MSRAGVSLVIDQLRAIADGQVQVIDHPPVPSMAGLEPTVGDPPQAGWIVELELPRRCWRQAVLLYRLMVTNRHEVDFHMSTGFMRRRFRYACKSQIVANHIERRLDDLIAGH